MEKLVVKGTIAEVVETMEGKGYHMEGFNEVSIKAKYFYAYKADYRGADYFSIKYKNGQYILTQF